ncbi:MAG: cytochrome c peroxidase [Patiriisocius sp.]|jgi:cytochrome c peroxidase
MSKFERSRTAYMYFKRIRHIISFFALILGVMTFISCKDDDCKPMEPGPEFTDLCAEGTIPIGTDWEFNIPSHIQEPIIPSNNPMKEEAIALGRHLFWEKKLSADNSISCGSCHSPQAAFTDPVQFSVGIDGIAGTRNSMALVNMAWNTNGFFWDGRTITLEDQILQPVINPIEMHNTWDNALAQLEDTVLYPDLFEAAFGSSCIDSIRATKAIAQFIRSMVSANAKYDKFLVGQAFFTESELLGLSLWDQEGGDSEIVSGGNLGGDCFHCHPLPGGQMRNNTFHNNGLDSVFTDQGRGGVTGLASDIGLFKVPTLRNVEFTAPYMHDGRFTTLEDVIEHYNSGVLASPTVDVNIIVTGEDSGLFLTPAKKQGLIDFMKSLSDAEFINNPDFSDPH